MGDRYDTAAAEDNSARDPIAASQAARHRAEAEAWDRIAAGTVADLAALEQAGHSWESLHRMLLDAVGDLDGQRLLDGGCGEGILARAAAKDGADVVAFDISMGMLTRLRKASSHDVVHPLRTAFEALPFADNSFDSAVGVFVLHHVHLAPAARELARVMKPGAQGAFVETWQRNPVIRGARRLRGKFGIAYYGTEDEKPLEPKDLAVLEDAGFDVTMDYPGLVFFQLIDNNVLRRRSPRMTKLFQSVDARLDRYRAAKPWGYYCVVKIRRRSN